MEFTFYQEIDNRIYIYNLDDVRNYYLLWIKVWPSCTGEEGRVEICTGYSGAVSLNVTLYRDWKEVRELAVEASRGQVLWAKGTASSEAGR